MTLKQADYGQSNLVEDIENRLSVEFQHQANMVNSAPHEDPATPTATVTAEILQQVIDQNQELMKLISANSGKSFSKNTNRPLTPSTGHFQGQPPRPMHAYFDKYFWTHGRGRYKGGNCNSKSPGHKYKATMESNMYGVNY